MENSTEVEPSNYHYYEQNGEESMRLAKGYQLRTAAGGFWLLNMEQKGVPYESPLSINSVGAEIWNHLQAGETAKTIVENLSKQYEISKDEIQEDVLAFCSQLKALGILIEG